MKSLILSIAFVATAIFTSQVSAQIENGAKIEFNKEVHDYGNIKNGANGTCTFEFTNTGNAPLIISKAQGSCGCTVPEVTKEALKPGESAPINVKFDSNGKSGEVTKTVNVRCNTPKIIEQIKIKASIKTKKSSAITNK